MAAIVSDTNRNTGGAPTAIRTITPADVDACARIAYAAHSVVAAAHNVPCEHPSVEFSIGMIGNKARDPNAVGLVAERAGRIAGSIFLNLFPDAPAAIGPLTVDPAAEGNAVGRHLMEAALKEAARRHIGRVRLVQSPSHLRSLALYAKLGFAPREPLALMTAGAAGARVASAAGGAVRAALAGDTAACNQLSTAIHGFARAFEVQNALDQRTLRVVESGGRIRGYSTGLGFRGHAVAETTDDLKLLIGTAPSVMGPGFFVPIRNAELFRWLLENGFRAQWPALLMSYGNYREPGGAILPSIAY